MCLRASMRVCVCLQLLSRSLSGSKVVKIGDEFNNILVLLKLFWLLMMIGLPN